jgi:metal-responsive CopG/Arc/MetJ family transcriptional regulator
MKTIQMTIDEGLLAEVDEAIRAMDTTRSAFIRQALTVALKRRRIAELERRHAEGYARFPVQPGEFDVPETSLAWGDAWGVAWGAHDEVAHETR